MIASEFGRRLQAVALAAALVGACGEDDGGATDLGAVTDGGDLGSMDGGSRDLGEPDSGARDLGPEDLGGMEDQGPTDTGPPDMGGSSEPPELVVFPFIQGIGRPWDLAFLPDGTMLITERDGRIRSAAAGSSQTRVILEPPSDLVVQGQSGMLGIAVDPDFESNRYVYTFMASNRAGRTDNRIRRWVMTEAGTLTEDRDILTDLAFGSNGGHSGGRIRFGPDGNLWITTGDNRAATIPQDLQVLGGKVLRVTREGAPAPGNPNIEGARPEIYFVGVRNPQGLTFRPGTQDAFICEHGPNEDDEITKLAAGGNGGWNPNDGMGNYNGYTGAVMSDSSIPGVVQPTYKVDDSAGMAGCDFLRGAGWKAWDGALIVGLLAGSRALVLSLDEAGTGLSKQPTVVLDTPSRLRGIVMGPDGAAYVAIDSNPGMIWRVTPM